MCRQLLKQPTLSRFIQANIIFYPLIPFNSYLSLDLSAGQYSDDNLHPITQWNYETNPAFLTEGILYRNGRLTIQDNGLYYVYSQLSMIEYMDSDDDTEPSSHKDSATIGHHVRRWNVLYPGEESLIRHSQSRATNTDDPYVEYVSHVGGVFQLRSGDEIYISVSDLSLVQADATSSYFGLYRI